MKIEVPLSAEEAYWHACTGTPYEPRYWPVALDPACPRSRIYFFPPWQLVHFDPWTKAPINPLGVITGLEGDLTPLGDSK